MKITILTIFPEFYDSFLNTSIIKRAISKGIVSFEIVNIRDFTLNKYRRIDNPPIGGGAGLIMMCQPIVDCLNHYKKENSHVILTSPRGTTYSQSKALELSKKDHLIIICGHYEGIDERITDYVDEMISIGDFILTGGEIPSLAIADSITRLLKDSISEESLLQESFDSNLLEYPQYTSPYDFEGKKVPDILYSGNHKAIEKWRRKQSLLLTKKYRKDLFDKLTLSKEDKTLLEEKNDPSWEQEAVNKGKKFIKD